MGCTLFSANLVFFVSLHVYTVLNCVCLQLTSSDVAESLGLVIGRYEYVERQQEPSVNSNAMDMCSDGNAAASSSLSVPRAVEVDCALLPESGHQDKDSIDTTTPGGANATSLEMPVDDDTDSRLQPADETGEPPDSSAQSDCGGHTASDVKTFAAVTDENESSASPGNTDNLIVTAASNVTQNQETGSSPDSDVNGHAVCSDDPCSDQARPSETAVDTTCTNTDQMPLAGEIPKQCTSTSGDAFSQLSVDGVYLSQPHGASLGSETTTHINTQSDEQ